MSGQELNGRHALVTGGSRGIGAAIVTCFLREGARVTVLGKSRGSFEKLSTEVSGLSANLDFISCDLANSGETDAVCKKIESLKVDILVNNAGINKVSLAHETDVADWDQVQAVNVRAPLVLTKACLPYMLKNKWGRIVGISSVFGSLTRKGRISYSTSKAALSGMTRSLAVDYADCGILVNTVSPGFIDTDLTRKILSQAEIEELCQQVPMRRLGKASEIAELVLYLSSARNTFMTGQDLILDGGFSVV